MHITAECCYFKSGEGSWLIWVNAGSEAGTMSLEAAEKLNAQLSRAIEEYKRHKWQKRKKQKIISMRREQS